MINQETLTTFGTQDTGRRQTKHKDTAQKNTKMSNMDPTKIRAEPGCPGVTGKTGWIGITIMCPNWETCLILNCYFSEPAL
jgi:hypothetical protein